MAREKAQFLRLPYDRFKNGNEDDNFDLTSNNSKYRRRFDPQRQTWTLFQKQGCRLVLTGAFLAMVVVTLKIYESKGTVNYSDKLRFNTITTALGLGLGLNFFEVFKDMAKVVRWRILSSRKYTVRELDMILGSESLLKVAQLMFNSLRKPRIFVVCGAWLLLNLLAQAAVATIPLFYSLDNGIDSSGIVTSPGIVGVPLLDCYYGNGTCFNKPGISPAAALFKAHIFGESGNTLKSCRYDTDDDIYSLPQECRFFLNRNGQEFAFRYEELNPDDKNLAYPFLTNRTIKSSTGQCSEYNVSESITINATDGEPGEMQFKFYNDTFSGGTLNIPWLYTAPSSTTYVYNDTRVPQEAVYMACGPRCMHIWMYRSEITNPDAAKRDRQLIKCPITVSEVSNAYDPRHEISDGIARLAASSISLQGRPSSPSSDHEVSWKQYQLFINGSYWETTVLGPQEVGALMARFAICSLAVMPLDSKYVFIPGTLPKLGYIVWIQWTWIAALCGAIMLAHSLILALMLFLARPVAVVDDSSLVTARLLRDLVAMIPHGEGSLLDGREIAAAIEERLQQLDQLPPVAGDGGNASACMVAYGAVDRGKSEWKGNNNALSTGRSSTGAGDGMEEKEEEEEKGRAGRALTVGRDVDVRNALKRNKFAAGWYK